MIVEVVLIIVAYCLGILSCAVLNICGLTSRKEEELYESENYHSLTSFVDPNHVCTCGSIRRTVRDMEREKIRAAPMGFGTGNINEGKKRIDRYD